MLESIGSVCTAWSIAFAAHVLRYVTSAGILELWIRCSPGLESRKLQSATSSPRQQSLEFWASLEAGAIFSFLLLATLYVLSRGGLQIFFDFSERSLGYHLLSFVAALALHDAYFYWTHRWMHAPKIFRFVHAHHHRSQTPSAWAAFSFAPAESFVQGAIYLLVPLLFPIHVTVLGAFVLWASVYSALIHCGYDLLRGPATRWISTPADHDRHHAGGKGNFGLYTTFWDRVMGTRVPRHQVIRNESEAK